MSKSPRPVLCPYCGHTQGERDRCRACGGLFEPLSRRATQIAMGPWFIRDERQPFRPGCSYEVLRKQVRAGRVQANTVIRGPTTRQFWNLARNVAGVAHLLGYCHKCGARVEPGAEACPSCDEPFRAPVDRDALGLQFPTPEAAAAAQAALDRDAAITARSEGEKAGRPRRRERPRGDDEVFTTELAPGEGTPGADLLDEVLNTAGPRPPATMPSGAGAPDSGDDVFEGALAASGPAGSPAAEALDFSPTGATPRGVETVPGAPRARPGALAWVLGAIIVSVLAVQIAMLKRMTRAETPAGVADAPATASPSPPQPIDPEAPASSASKPSNIDSRTPLPSSPEREALPPSSVELLSEEPPVIQPLTLADALRQARALERDHKPGEALALLHRLRDTTPVNRRTADLDEEVRRLEGVVAGRGGSKVFEVE